MLQNPYLVAKIGADTAKNERTFAKKNGNYPTPRLDLPYPSRCTGRVAEVNVSVHPAKDEPSEIWPACQSLNAPSPGSKGAEPWARLPNRRQHSLCDRNASQWRRSPSPSHSLPFRSRPLHNHLSMFGPTQSNCLTTFWQTVRDSLSRPTFATKDLLELG